MKKLKYLAALTVLVAQSTFAASWGYSADKAPEHWANLDESYHACAGVNQSPINIQSTVKANLTPLNFDYANTKAKSIINNGHTVEVRFNSGAYLNLDNHKFELKQAHFHTPSENLLNGKSYPAEMHLVHASEEGELAVIAVLFEQGKENQNLATFWSNLPKQQNQEIDLKQTIFAGNFLPKQYDYYRFNGSLTTPPCSEGVRWIVLKDIQTISKNQVEKFANLMGVPNNRPVQKQNARLVLE